MKRKLFGMAGVAAMLLSFMALAGCKTDADDGGGGGGGGSACSIAVTSDTAAKTITLTFTGATWNPDTPEAPLWVALRYCFDITSDGFTNNEFSVNYTSTLSADRKTVTITLSKQDNNTGTITFKPYPTAESYLSHISTAPNTGVSISGSEVTFTIE
jgi:DNA/RNA endonuclease YhcR with UshA esterase domain